jgi:hypothetical protein
MTTHSHTCVCCLRTTPIFLHLSCAWLCFRAAVVCVILICLRISLFEPLPQALQSLNAMSNGDLRKAINLLQSAQRMHPAGGTVTESDIIEVACVRLVFNSSQVATFDCRV